MISPGVSEISGFVLSVAEDFLQRGETDRRCPECGGSMEEIAEGSTTVIKCATLGCIERVFRGI